MPLRVNSGIAVPVLPPASAFRVAPSVVNLPIPLIGQIGNQWCWAACAQMVDYWRKGAAASISQCRLASDYVAPDCCSRSPPSPHCDRPLTASGITAVWRRLGSIAASEGGQLSMTLVHAELAAHRPVQLGLTSPQGGHVVLVVGANPDADQYTVHDPLPREHGSITLATSAQLNAGLGQGDWTHSWTNI